MESATSERSFAPSIPADKLGWRRIAPLLLAAFAVAGCSICQVPAQAGAEGGRDKARRLHSRQLAEGQPKVFATLAMSQAVQHRLVVAADYVCTPSGFGRRATCRARTAQY